MGTDQLELSDGRLNVAYDGLDGRLYELDVIVEGAVDRPTHTELGPALNALYAKAFAALVADPSLGGLSCDIREGATDTAPALELSINHRPFSAPSAAFALHCVVAYYQPEGVPPRREPILEALVAALGQNVPGPDPCVREAVLAAVLGDFGAGLGMPILRNSDRPLECVAGLPIAVFHDGPQRANDENLGLVLYTAQPALELFVPGGNVATLDALVQTAIGVIRASDHPGGLALQLVEADTEPEVLRQAYSGPLIAARIDMELTYGTRRGDPYTALL